MVRKRSPAMCIMPQALMVRLETQIRDRLQYETKDSSRILLEHLLQFVCVRDSNDVMARFKAFSMHYHKMYQHVDEYRELLLFVFDCVVDIYMEWFYFRRHSIGFFRILEKHDIYQELQTILDRYWSQYVLHNKMPHATWERLETLLHIVEFPLGIEVLRHHLKDIIEVYLKEVLQSITEWVGFYRSSSSHVTIYHGKAIIDVSKEGHLVGKCILALFKRFPEETQCYWMTASTYKEDYINLFMLLMVEGRDILMKEAITMAAMVVVMLIEMDPWKAADVMSRDFLQFYETTTLIVSADEKRCMKEDQQELIELVMMKVLLMCSKKHLLLVPLDEYGGLLRCKIRPRLHQLCLRAVIEPIQRFVTFQTLACYLETLHELVRRYAGTYASELECLVNDKELDQWVDNIFDHWDDPVEGVSYQMRASFVHIVGLFQLRPKLGNDFTEAHNDGLALEGQIWTLNYTDRCLGYHIMG
jgi:hypothetical protein